MGRGFEVQGSQQQPAGTIAQVNHFDVFLPAERCSIHGHFDHLKSNHSLDLCLMHSRVGEPRFHPVCRTSRSPGGSSHTFATEHRWVFFIERFPRYAAYWWRLQ